jgi:hypothetical protein
MTAGLFASLAVPSTQREKEVLGPKRDEMASDAKAKAEEFADKAADVTATAGEAATEEARQQDLSPEQLREKLSHVGQAATEAGKQRAEERGLTEPESEQAAESPQAQDTGGELSDRPPQA